MADKLGDLLALIPDIFYDIIARVVPGVVLFYQIRFFGLAPWPVNAVEQQGLAGLLFVAYVIGIVLAAPATMLVDEWFVRNRGNFRLATRMDGIAAVRPEAWQRLLKMRAETTCCQTLVFGQIIVLGWCWGFGLHEDIKPGLALLVLFAIAAASRSLLLYSRVKEIENRFVQRQRQAVATKG